MNVLAERIERMSIPEPNTGCWLWLGALGANGYGTIGISDRRMSAHRASYTSANNGEIAQDKIVLHKCDTKSCVNPSHLILGTHHDNAIDRSKRGRPDLSSDKQKAEWSAKGGKRGSWGLGLNVKERLERLSLMVESGCREWQGTVTKSTGYGEIKVNGRKITAHRATWIAHHGEIPTGLVVMHSCDNRLCVNLKHLSVGTRRDNMIDMGRKGRSGFDQMSVEQRCENAQRAMQTMGVDGLSARSKAAQQTMGSKGRIDKANKGWETRRIRTTTEQRHLKAIGIWTPEMRTAHSQKCKDGRREAKEAREAAVRRPNLLLFNLLAPRFQPRAA